MVKGRKKTKKRTFTAGFSGIAICGILLLLLQDFTLHQKPEIPQLTAHRKEQIIYHEGYTVSYNSEYRIANWVAYELTKEETDGKVKRSNRFIPDPMVREDETVTNEDYRQSGYDKGHLAPAGDMKWSYKAMQESFYFTNICPQNRELNTGIWNTLEMQCRKWANQYGALLIVTGPVIEDSLERLGQHRVGIPNSFYKVICIPSGDKPRSIGFLFENKNYTKTPILSMAVPVDSVEKVTGIDFSPPSRLKSRQRWKVLCPGNSNVRYCPIPQGISICEKS
jgi:endonuclease G